MVEARAHQNRHGAKRLSGKNITSSTSFCPTLAAAVSKCTVREGSKAHSGFAQHFKRDSQQKLKKKMLNF